MGFQLSRVRDSAHSHVTLPNAFTLTNADFFQIDDVLPTNVETKLGGFYINAGELSLEEISMSAHSLEAPEEDRLPNGVNFHNNIRERWKSTSCYFRGITLPNSLVVYFIPVRVTDFPRTPIRGPNPPSTAHDFQTLPKH